MHFSSLQQMPPFFLKKISFSWRTSFFLSPYALQYNFSYRDFTIPKISFLVVRWCCSDVHERRWKLFKRYFPQDFPFSNCNWRNFMNRCKHDKAHRSVFKRFLIEQKTTDVREEKNWNMRKSIEIWFEEFLRIYWLILFYYFPKISGLIG